MRSRSILSIVVMILITNQNFINAQQELQLRFLGDTEISLLPQYFIIGFYEKCGIPGAVEAGELITHFNEYSKNVKAGFKFQQKYTCNAEGLVSFYNDTYNAKDFSKEVNSQVPFAESENPEAACLEQQRYFNEYKKAYEPLNEFLFDTRSRAKISLDMQKGKIYYPIYEYLLLRMDKTSLDKWIVDWVNYDTRTQYTLEQWAFEEINLLPTREEFETLVSFYKTKTCSYYRGLNVLQKIWYRIAGGIKTIDMAKACHPSLTLGVGLAMLGKDIVYEVLHIAADIFTGGIWRIIRSVAKCALALYHLFEAIVHFHGFDAVFFSEHLGKAMGYMFGVAMTLTTGAGGVK